MIEKADDVSYRKRNKRRNELIHMTMDELNKSIMTYAERPKYLDENGKLIFLDEK